MPLRPTAKTPPTVAPSQSGSATHCPRSASAASSSVDEGARPAADGHLLDRDPRDPAGAGTSRVPRDRARRRRPIACARPRPRPGPCSRSARRTTRGRSRPRSRSHPCSRRGCSAGRRTEIRRAAPSAGSPSPAGSNASRRRGLRVEVVGAEQHGHEVTLLDADAVLAGEHTACRDAMPARSPCPRPAPAPSHPARAGRTTSSGWRLPSPAWNTFMTMRSYLSAIA